MKTITTNRNRIEDDGDWDVICRPQPKPMAFSCQACNEDWTARIGVRGWNRCPHCGRVHNARELL